MPLPTQMGKFSHPKISRRLPAVHACRGTVRATRNDQEDASHENEDQASIERGGDRFRRPAVGSACAIACPANPARRRDRCRRHRRCRHRPERAGGRRLGDRRDQGSADPLRQDGRHRRSGPLRRSRPAEGQLQRLGARLRTGRFAEGAERARQGRQSARRRGAERSGGREGLSGDLLVLDDEDPGRERVRQQGRQGQGHPGEEDAVRVAERVEEPRLRRLPSARPAVDPHRSGGLRRVQVGRRGLATPHHVGPSRHR